MSNIHQHNFHNLRMRISNSDYWDLFISYDLANENDFSKLMSDSLIIDFDFCNDRVFEDTCLGVYAVEYTDQYGICRTSIYGIEYDEQYAKAVASAYGIPYGLPYGKAIPLVNFKTIHNLSSWSGATINPDGIVLNDIGYTMVDNKFIDYDCSLHSLGSIYEIEYEPNYGALLPISGFNQFITGASLTLTTADTKFTMTLVSGCTYEYPVEFVDDGECPNRYIRLCGGFYQGFFKLSDKTFEEPVNDNKFLDPIDKSCICPTEETVVEDESTEEIPYDYQTLPDTYEIGWAAEFWLNKNDGEDCDYIAGKILNDDFPENKGFFFYMGTRAENKFWNTNPNETGYTTNSGIPLSPPEETTTELADNPFLVYNGNGAICGKPEFTGITEVTTQSKDPKLDLMDNALGFRITDDNRIGYRKLVGSGGTAVMVEEYSDPEIICPGLWQQVVVTFTPTETFKRGRRRKGVLKFYIDGFLKLSVNDFDEFIFRELDEHRDKQIGVPFNFSLGGGTQGLLENLTLFGRDPEDLGLCIEKYFAGSFIGCLSRFKFYNESLSVCDIRYLFDSMKDVFKLEEPPTKPAEPVIYWGKANSTTITQLEATLLFEYEERDSAVNSFVTMRRGLGYGYILIPASFEQPTDLFDGQSDDARFNIPCITHPDIVIKDDNGVPIIYNVYRTFNKMFAEYSVWMTD